MTPVESALPMLPLNPARIPQSLAEAVRLIASGRLAEAEAALERIVAVSPRLAEAHLHLGRIALARGRPDEAAARFARAAELKPGDPAIWLGWAQAAAKAGGPAPAQVLKAARAARLAPPLLRRIEAALGGAPAKSPTGGVPAQRLQALADRLRRGDFAAARREAQALLLAQPDSAVLHDMLAAALAALGETAAAEASHRKAIALAPGHAEARANFGRFLVERGRLSEGISQLREAIRLAPRLAPAHAHLAVALERAGQTEAAAEAARRALELEPRSPSARLVLARCQIADGRPAEALATLEPLARGEAPPVEALLVRAEALALTDRDDEALAALDAAIARAPRAPRPLAEKARLLQRLGRFDEAEALFRRAIEVAPGDGTAYRIFMASHRARPDDPLVARMEEHWADPVLSPENRVQFGFALAKAMEDIGAHERVFTYLRPANAAVRARQPFDLDALRRDHDAIMAACEGIDFAARRVEGASPYAPIFVTGVPRSGTTLVESILAAHRTVTGGGELGLANRAAARLVFTPDGRRPRLAELPDAAIAAAGQEAEAAMRARFPAAERLTDKSVQSYNFLGLLRLMLPRAALVVVERDPRDTLLSMYRNLFAPGQHRYAYDLGDLAAFWREYRRIMRFWRERLAGGYHVVRYEELVANPEEQTRALLAACGLEWEDACLAFHETRRRVDTLSVHQVRQPIHRGSLRAWERHAEDIAPLLEALEEIEAEEGQQ